MRSAAALLWLAVTVSGCAPTVQLEILAKDATARDVRLATKCQAEVESRRAREWRPRDVAIVIEQTNLCLRYHGSPVCVARRGESASPPPGCLPRSSISR